MASAAATYGGSGQQLDRGGLDCLKRRAGEIAGQNPAPCLGPEDVGAFDHQQVRRRERLLQQQSSYPIRSILFDDPFEPTLASTTTVILCLGCDRVADRRGSTALRAGPRAGGPR